MFLLGNSRFNRSQTRHEIDMIGMTVPIEYFTYYIPFQYTFKQYPTELLTLNLTVPISSVLPVSKNFPTLTGINYFELSL